MKLCEAMLQGKTKITRFFYRQVSLQLAATKDLLKLGLGFRHIIQADGHAFVGGDKTGHRPLEHELVKFRPETG